LSLNSSIVFICDKGLHPAELLLLLPLVLLLLTAIPYFFADRYRWFCDQTDTEKKNKRMPLLKQQEQHMA
jgi:hypothetical protein